MAVSAFLDTSVLIAGMIDFGPQSAPAQRLLHNVVDGSLTRAGTAWHCCLEFFSVATRLPPEFRLTPASATQLLEEVTFAHLTIYDLPAADRLPFFKVAAQENAAGGRIYDAYIADVARLSEMTRFPGSLRNVIQQACCGSAGGFAGSVAAPQSSRSPAQKCDHT